MIHIYIGTRAEAIKMAPVIRALEKREIEYQIIATGQHKIEGVLRTFDINVSPRYLLPPQGAFTIVKGVLYVLRVAKKVRQFLQKERPKWVLYHGDTMTTAGVALGAHRRGVWKKGHVEAGLRSGSIWEPFPEEIARRIVDPISDYNFAPSERAAENLRKEKIRGKIYVTGNTVVDAVHYALEKGKDVELPWQEKNYIIVSVHRFENLLSTRRLSNIVNAILDLAQVFDGLVVWPLHSITKRALKKHRLWKLVERGTRKSLLVLEPLDYVTMIKAVSKARLLLVDGGSLQEESITLRVPALLLRKRTERVAGLETPYNYLVGTDRESIVDTALYVLENFRRLQRKKFKNPYGDGRAGERIASIILGQL